MLMVSIRLAEFYYYFASSFFLNTNQISVTHAYVYIFGVIHDKSNNCTETEEKLNNRIFLVNRQTHTEIWMWNFSDWNWYIDGVWCTHCLIEVYFCFCVVCYFDYLFFLSFFRRFKFLLFFFSCNFSSVVFRNISMDFSTLKHQLYIYESGDLNCI